MSTRCPYCHGDLKNIDGKRHTRERLEAIHRETCPGLLRKRKQ